MGSLGCVMRSSPKKGDLSPGLGCDMLSRAFLGVLWAVLLLSGGSGGVQRWAHQPPYTEANPGEEVLLPCIVQNIQVGQHCWPFVNHLISMKISLLALISMKIPSDNFAALITS